MNLKDHLIEENWDAFTPENHAMWRFLFDRQLGIFEGRVAIEHLESLKRLGIARDRIPKFSEINTILKEHTGWSVAPVPCIVPDDVFFSLLKNRIFPSTCFIRTPEQQDYLQEPDIFHDIFGHLPLLVLPEFANYMEAFAKLALNACEKGYLPFATRLYWFTIEFGLIKPQSIADNALRTYGAGIVSSFTETIYCVESPKPVRLPFSLERVMRTDYRIDDLQKNYFVIESYEELFKATLQDHDALFKRVEAEGMIPAGTLLPGEVNIPANAPLS